MKHTIKQLISTSSQRINQLDSEIILAHVLRKTREFLFANPEFEITFWQKIKFDNLVKQRQKNIPVAYLIGHKEFFGLDFFVNKNVLVPRPDTEIIVEQVLKEIQNSKVSAKGGSAFGGKIQNLLLIDVGTGSGCIPISILDSLKKRNDEMSGANFVTSVPDKFRPAQFVTPIQTIAIDISKKALCVAKKNVKKHNVEIEFLHGNLLKPIIKNLNLNQFKSMLITANLPYLTEKQFQDEPSIQHEPKLALVADNEGLALYEELLQQIKQLLSSIDCSLSTMFEIDPTQTDKIKILIKKYLPEANIEIKKDLAGLDRLVIIKF
ncbi:MAG: peptide chain release factor N(5)-glutamine methyltransferase [Candidatus Magasanikbacteria bacterium CG_4_10_14_0_8_um_filter_32_14]|uniref:Peptide chain release factor N(5)-glutamine methyltransferase n=1 Tax=Candidatus Magasanikbacteria bacterium CG_4_10_14_0_8_um_filter_32_14 TaxID=1974640 RepID=A0A2M7RA52_9BACT|nr:MAG: peptide chain release factor N(5)-glutamine methyltransferase [Candidatus Magasanikbacteria bacterium CG_4_10_14_0_8_um_filter_32_14]